MSVRTQEMTQEKQPNTRPAPTRIDADFRLYIEAIIAASQVRIRNATPQFYPEFETIGEVAAKALRELEAEARGEIPPDPVFVLISALSPEAVRVVAALMWIGRGDGFDGFEDAFQHACGDHADNLAGYISDKAPLHEYLAAGLKRLNAETRS